MEGLMPLEPYEYPEVLYCDKCRADVDTKIVDRVAVYTNGKQEIHVPYKAAVCPVCGNTLCERDQDFQFVNMTLDHEAKE
jgi:hypothetical protein